MGCTRLRAQLPLCRLNSNPCHRAENLENHPNGADSVEPNWLDFTRGGSA